MKKIDLSDCTFIIPVRIDSGDRTRNITTVLCYLLKTFNTKVILKESDEKSLVQEYVIEQIGEFLNEDELNNLIYTGCQILNKSLFNSCVVSNFSISNVWNELINKDELYGFESLEDFRHLTDLNIYKQILKN